MTSIIFDLGNVLIRWDPRHHYRSRFDRTEDMEFFLREVCPMAWNHEMDLGKPFAQAIAERQALFPDWAELIAEWQSGWVRMLGGPIDEMVSLLPRLQQAGYGIYALTNWSAETFPVARARFPWLATFADILVSGEEGVGKPDPAAFHLMLTRNGLDASQTVFIDDNLGNVEAAVATGMHAIHFTSPSQCQQALEALGIRPVPILAR
jgi:2-haloacid dehalogenase